MRPVSRHSILGFSALTALVACTRQEPSALPVPPSKVEAAVATSSPLPELAKPAPKPQRFVVIGDYGQDGPDEALVASLVNRLNPDFVLTVGDNNYPDGLASTIDANVGKHFQQFIGGYRGEFGPGSPVNRFWPS